MSTRTFRRSAAVALAALTLLGAAGCSKDSKESSSSTTAPASNTTGPGGSGADGSTGGQPVTQATFTQAINNPVNATVDGKELPLYTACQNSKGDLQIKTDEGGDNRKEIVVAGGANGQPSTGMSYDGRLSTVEVGKDGDRTTATGTFERGRITVAYGKLPDCPNG